MLSHNEAKFKMTANELIQNNESLEEDEDNHVKFKEMVRNTRNFFNPKKKAAKSGEQSLNKVVRHQEFSRIMLDNEAMLKRLQARQSNYNVLRWEKDRKT